MSANEQTRLNILKLYAILDTAAEDLFDDLTRLAAMICETPIGLVSLVDEKRQWFKARIGLDATETPRDQAFCAHAIDKSELMIVEDASEDPRFVNNPLVTDEPNIRFYAGAPLIVSEGHALGTLCVIDRKPRQLTELQKQALLVLRQAVVTQIEHRRARQEVQALRALLPMCAWCRAIRIEEDGEQRWQSINQFLSGLAPLTHGICPSCMKSQLEAEGS